MFYDLLRLHDQSIRGGESPSDKLAQVVPITAYAGTEQIQTVFAPGTKVAIVPYIVAEADADGKITIPGVAYTGAGATGEGGVLLIAPGYALQGGKALGSPAVA